MNLYGIETDADCRRKLDELLELNRAAQEQPNKETVSVIKSRLKECYQKGKTGKGEAQMSAVERAFFWPAVSEAYVNSPNLNSRHAWQEGLSDIDYYLKYYRPSED